MTEIEEFVYLCRYYGALDELVQAGGGNISVKDYENKILIIKSSGFNLSDIEINKGYCMLKLDMTLCNEETSLDKFIINDSKPSIETYFHIFLKKYTVHLHPTLINIYMCSDQEIPSLDHRYLLIDYYQPGFELSKIIHSMYSGENIIFLKNHGIIFTCDNYDDLIDIINSTYKKFVMHRIEFIDLFMDLSDYDYLKKKCHHNILFRIPENERMSLSQSDNLNIIPYTPDIVVYLGRTILDAEKNENSIICDHKIIKYKNNYFISDRSKYKCYQILEVLRSYININRQITTNLKLSEKDVNKLLGWDKEIYRLQQ